MKRSLSPHSPDGYDDGGMGTKRPRRRPVDVYTPIRSVEDAARMLLEPMNDFQYEPLGPDQVRILHLHPGSYTDTLTCDLKTVPIAELKMVAYEALSYCWGLGEAKEEIYIKTSIFQAPQQSRRAPGLRTVIRTVMPQKKFFVTGNLEKALRRLRDPGVSLPLWIDAICIDQKNEAEKSQQVARLAEIFHHASAVRVWLGEKDENSSKAMNFIYSILNLRILEDFVESARASPHPWYNLTQLMRREWFTRRWVVQEIALARETYLHIGDEHIHWDDFAEAVALFAQEEGRISKLFGNSQDFVTGSRALGDVRASGAYSIVQITNNLLRWVGDEQPHRLIPLENLVSQLLIFEARDPRDTIFAMLAIAKDIPRNLSLAEAPMQSSSTNSAVQAPLLAADYSQNTLEVFKNFVAFCTLNGSLDIICRHWAPHLLPIKLGARDRLNRAKDPTYLPKPREIELPTWIPLLADSAFGPPQEAISGTRQAANDLAGEPGRPTYDAAKGSKAAVWFGEVGASGPNQFDSTESILYQTAIPGWTPDNFMETAEETMKPGRNRRSDGCLYVRGFIVDQIGNLSDRLPLAMISTDALQMTGWTRQMEVDSNLPDEIWRTFVADRDKEGHNPPLWYRRALLTCIAHRNANGDVHINNILTSHMKSLTMREFLSRLEAVVWNKKVFKMRQQESSVHHGFGLAPSKAEKGDFICILFGCSVPVVLRRHGNEGQEDVYYELVGEAYVHGMMNGEAMSEYEGRSEAELGNVATLFRLR